MNNLNFGLGGEYKLVVSRNNEVVSDTGWFKNLVLDSGLDLIGTLGVNQSQFTPIVQYIRVGTGTSTPIPTQSLLDNQIAVVSGTVNETATLAGAPTYVATILSTYAFAQGAVIGNITEVGVSPFATGNLFSRSLITDAQGTPTSIALLAIDQLTLYYRLNITPNITDNTGTFQIGSTVYNYTSRVSAIDNFMGYYALNYFYKIYSLTCYDGAIGAITASPGGTSELLGGSKLTVAAYTPGTYYLKYTVTVANAQGNFATGIRSFKLHYGGPYQSHSFQMEINPPIVKTNTQVLTLNVQLSWSRT